MDTAVSEGKDGQPAQARLRTRPIDLSPKASPLERLIAVGLPALVFLLYVNMGTHGFTGVPGISVDARFNNAILEHLYLWASGHTASIWSPDFFYPYPDALTFSDNHFGSGAIYVTGRFLGLDRESAFAVWHFAGYALSFAGMFWVLRRFGLSAAAASIGGVIFAFAGTMLIRTEHSQLVYRFASPLAVYFAWRFLTTARLGYAGLFLVFLSWQFWCSVYLGVFLILLFIAIAPALLLFRESRISLLQLPAKLIRNQGWLDALGVAAGLAAVAATGVMLHRYANAATMYGFARDPQLILSQLPRFQNYIMLQGSSLYRDWSRGIREDEYGHERQMFVGLCAVVLMAASFLPARDGRPAWRTAWAVLSVALVLLVLLTVRRLPGGFTPYKFLAPVPGFNSVRAVGRVIEIMLLPVGFMAAAGVDVLRRQGSRLGPWASGAVVIAAGWVLVVETMSMNIYWSPRETLAARKAEVASHLPPGLKSDAVIAYRERTDPNDRFYYTDVDGMILAQDHKVPSLNGYSGNFPRGYRAMRRCEEILFPIAGGAYYRNLTAAEANAIARRVVPVDFLEPCDLIPAGDTGFQYDKPVELFYQGRLTPSVVAGLRLSVEDVRVEGDRLKVRLKLANQGAATLPANFVASGRNINFSWRYSDPAAPPPKGDGWTTRALLHSSVPPGGGMIQTLTLPPPGAPGRFKLELTMVQEEVMWLHDNGLAIAETPVLVEAAEGGTVSLVPPGAEPKGAQSADRQPSSQPARAAQSTTPPSP